MKTKKILSIALCALSLCVSAQDETNNWIMDVDQENSTMAQMLYQMNFNAFMDSPAFNGAFILPSKASLENYVDPLSWNESHTPEKWEFLVDNTYTLTANVYRTTEGWDGEKGNRLTSYKSSQYSSNSTLDDRMTRILKNSILLEKPHAGKKYYQTAGNSFVKIENPGTANMTIAGAGDIEQGKSYKVTSKEIDGRWQMLSIDGFVNEPSLSILQQLEAQPEFSEFKTIMEVAGLFNGQNPSNGASAVGDFGVLYSVQYGTPGAEDIPTGMSSWNYKTLQLFNNYHYTLYVPTNVAMQKAYATGLPTPADVTAIEEEIESLADSEDAWMEETKRKIADLETRINSILEVYRDFVRYHIQDCAIFYADGEGSGSFSTTKFSYNKATYINEKENGDYEILPTGNYSIGPLYKLNVKASAASMSVTDVLGNTANVVPALSNIMAQVRWRSSNNAYRANNVSSSFVVIQGIDAPLCYDKDQFVYQYKRIETSF